MKMIAQDPVQRTQRVRVGMIGLAAVLLLIGLAAAIFATASRDRQVAAASGRTNVVAEMVANSSDAVAKEPLVELGVAPSAAIEANSVAVDNAVTADGPVNP